MLIEINNLLTFNPVLTFYTFILLHFCISYSRGTIPLLIVLLLSFLYVLPFTVHFSHMMILSLIPFLFYPTLLFTILNPIPLLYFHVLFPHFPFNISLIPPFSFFPFSPYPPLPIPPHLPLHLPTSLLPHPLSNPSVSL